MARQRASSTKSGAVLTAEWSSRLPQLDAQEGGDSAWAQWHEASRRLDFAFAPTEPSGVAPMQTESGIGEAVVTEERARFLTVHTVMVVARRNNRVCPAPDQWIRLYHQLGGESRPDLPAPPLQPWLWPNLSGLQRRLRFREHAEWAERHGCLDEVARFIGDMAEADWVHMGDN
jgi:hypothetical protein